MNVNNFLKWSRNLAAAACFTLLVPNLLAACRIQEKVGP